VAHWLNPHRLVEALEERARKRQIPPNWFVNKVSALMLRRWNGWCAELSWDKDFWNIDRLWKRGSCEDIVIWFEDLALCGWNIDIIEPMVPGFYPRYIIYPAINPIGRGEVIRIQGVENCTKRLEEFNAKHKRLQNALWGED
jgi:hypothetical protein